MEIRRKVDSGSGGCGHCLLRFSLPLSLSESLVVSVAGNEWVMIYLYVGNDGRGGKCKSLVRFCFDFVGNFWLLEDRSGITERSGVHEAEDESNSPTRRLHESR